MALSDEYAIPDGRIRIEYVVMKSRFIATILAASSVQEAKTQVQQIRAEIPTASHHAFAFRVGYGNSVIEGMSDDGEPTGTGGPPILARLRGADLGDVLVVVSRVFGGTKLGTGRLGRAYGEATRQALASLQTRLKTPLCLVRIDIPYPAFQSVRQRIIDLKGTIEDITYEDRTTLCVSFPTRHLAALEEFVIEITRGQSSVIRIDR